ncbi:M20/M25/M40 family metallo-hydrolase [Sphingomonas sp. LY160]|uniref:M20/M25/M40 family metallo-hydrolase n=1 Tax=Sphingomonas sp. LY160 TaxID=3095342 RepID=UPI002ADECE6C|nr:M20/M25/M40 family metallo-hydrolase [Sphingomonas sp. LY160]MEA1071880.1 M20/M25/M40 family metallo-hydrolase [Sphingomonas sp. LY160]
MRSIAAACLLFASTAVFAANPVTEPSKLDPAWQAQTRAVYQKIVEYPTVLPRKQTPAMAEYLAGELRAAGFPASDIRVVPYKSEDGTDTVTLIARWRAAKPVAKPILLMAHMDVVEAKREDWKLDPFKFVEKDGYFYGRGTYDNKAGLVGLTMSWLKLKKAGFQPKRDLILFFTGDEETGGTGAALGATEWKAMTDAEYALNSDGGGGAFTHDGKPLGYGLQTAEKTYQSYTLTTTNRGGHSSRPRPDNAIYDLADALKKLQGHRFTPMLNETTRAYFTARAKQEGSSALGTSMRAWLANDKDGAAADAIEVSELEVGLTRTRCVATMLEGGHADNALPQTARAGVNCRIMPGIAPAAVQAELQQAVGPNVVVAPKVVREAKVTPPSPLRADVTGAYLAAVQTLLGKEQEVVPLMSTGATDGLHFRAAGIPVYGVDGSWVISPDDERAHGLDERMPVRAVYDNVLFWEMMLKRLAG